ncbi:MAG: glycosyltransferase family 1 protein [Anaerolineae bacterium]|nr:glycosyltransferase family 1 protein [Anaerolineae bacterium]
MMRVALLTDTFLPKVDGIVTVICLLLDHLAARGVDTLVLAPRLGSIDHYGPTRVVTAPGVPFPFYPDLKMALPTPAIWRALHQFQPDVLHFIHPSVFGLVNYALLRRLRPGWPALVSYHLDYGQIARHYRVGPVNAGFIEPTINFLTRRIMNASDYNLAPSRLVQQRLREIGVTHPVGLWRRGVDAERFHPRHASADMRAALTDGHPDAVLLLYVGRLSSEKRLEQLKAVLAAVPNTRLALVGDGPARPALEAFLTGTPTRFMGYLQGEALSQAYASADIFVFPSAIESFGLVVVEAMAAGLPVVAARVGGVGDVVSEGRTGYTFAVDDTAPLIAGVRAISENPGGRRAMSLAARALAETLSWPAMMDEVIDHYRRLARHST